ncbi:hypothetical protein FDP41_007493 [Naegleria fowleri]|uniref:Uncharacterized protein n=1 Tax=Naegleria fowleri TaxID=5763 RepID=A0A6A5C978_NAEFO|nr:uncharacterized protein FDP41_007493 [Naegleria fowleri]KAF0984316.1 hypothetical protein FDP41_007493 [Naegleria fowleri]
MYLNSHYLCSHFIELNDEDDHDLLFCMSNSPNASTDAISPQDQSDEEDQMTPTKDHHSTLGVSTSSELNIGEGDDRFNLYDRDHEEKPSWYEDSSSLKVVVSSYDNHYHHHHHHQHSQQQCWNMAEEEDFLGFFPEEKDHFEERATMLSSHHPLVPLFHAGHSSYMMMFQPMSSLESQTSPATTSTATTAALNMLYAPFTECSSVEKKTKGSIEKSWTPPHPLYGAHLNLEECGLMLSPQHGATTSFFSTTNNKHHNNNNNTNNSSTLVVRDGSQTAACKHGSVASSTTTISDNNNHNGNLITTSSYDVTTGSSEVKESMVNTNPIGLTSSFLASSNSPSSPTKYDIATESTFSKSALDGSSTEGEPYSPPCINTISIKGQNSKKIISTSPKRKRDVTRDSETDSSTEEEEKEDSLKLVIDDDENKKSIATCAQSSNKKVGQHGRSKQVKNTQPHTKKLRKKKKSHPSQHVAQQTSSSSSSSSTSQNHPISIHTKKYTLKEIEEFNTSNQAQVYFSTLNLAVFGKEIPNHPHLKIELDMPWPDNYVKPSVYNKQGQWAKDDTYLAKFKVIVTSSQGMNQPLDVMNIRLLVVTQKNTDKPDGHSLKVNLLAGSKSIKGSPDMYYLDKDPNGKPLLNVIGIEQPEEGKIMFTCQVSSSNNALWKNKYAEYKLVVFDSSNLLAHYGYLSDGFKVAKTPKIRKDSPIKENPLRESTQTESTSASEDTTSSNGGIATCEKDHLDSVFVQERGKKKKKLKISEPTIVYQDGKKYKITVEHVEE